MELEITQDQIDDLKRTPVLNDGSINTETDE